MWSGCFAEVATVTGCTHQTRYDAARALHDSLFNYGINDIMMTSNKDKLATAAFCSSWFSDASRYCIFQRVLRQRTRGRQTAVHVHVHVHVDTKWKAGAHLTFAATDEIASFLRFLLLDTAVPMLAWKQRRSENGSFQNDHDSVKCTKGGKKTSSVTRPLQN